MTRSKVAVIIGSQIAGYATEDNTSKSLARLFSRIGVKVYSISDLGESGLDDLLSSLACDVVALIGEAKDFTRGTRSHEDSTPIILSFAPKDQIATAKEYLRIANALILCDSSNRNWLPEVSEVAYRFLESLTTPSMLNVDVADIKRIAKGIGLAVSISADSHERIVESLPSECLVSKSALLHFSCNEDVSLREVYSITKSITLKKGLVAEELEISTHTEARRLIRKVNVKMGIRILNRIKFKGNPAENRINLTAIFFGL